MPKKVERSVIRYSQTTSQLYLKNYGQIQQDQYVLRPPPVTLEGPTFLKTGSVYLS